MTAKKKVARVYLPNVQVYFPEQDKVLYDRLQKASEKMGVSISTLCLLVLRLGMPAFE